MNQHSLSLRSVYDNVFYFRNLTKENRKLKQKMFKSVSLETCSSSSSETGREALTSSSSAESTDSQMSPADQAEHSAITALHDQSELMISPGDKNHHQNNDSSADQHHPGPGETKEEYNNNVTAGEAPHFVIVADNLRQRPPKLVVLDNAEDTGDTTSDNTDNKTATTPTNDRSSLQMTQTR